MDEDMNEVIGKFYEAMAEERANNDWEDEEEANHEPIDALMDAGVWSLSPDFRAYQQAESLEDVNGKEALYVNFGNYQYSVLGNWDAQDLKDFSFSPSDIVVSLSGLRPVSEDPDEEQAITEGNVEAARDLQTRDLHLTADSDFDDITGTKPYVEGFQITKENTKDYLTFRRAITQKLLDLGEISFDAIPQYLRLKESGKDFFDMAEAVMEEKAVKNRFKLACKPYLKEYYQREEAVKNYKGAPLTSESLPQERFMQVMHDSMGKKNKDGKTLSYAYLATKALYEAKVPKDVIVACINNLAPSAVKDPARKEVYGVTYAEYLTSHFEKSKTYERMMQTAKGR